MGSIIERLKTERLAGSFIKTLINKMLVLITRLVNNIYGSKCALMAYNTNFDKTVTRVPRLA